MNAGMLSKELKTADGLEESLVVALTQMTSFYMDRGFTMGLDEREVEEVKGILAKLKEDSLKHKRILEEVNALIKEGKNDL